MIYLVNGDDRHLILKRVQSIIKNAKAQSDDIYRYDGSDKTFSLERVIFECRNVTLFSKKMVLLQDPSFFKNKMDEKEEQIFIKLCQEHQDEFNLIIYSDTTIDKKFKWYKNVAKYVEVINVLKMNDKEFEKYVTQSIIDADIQMEKRLIPTLIQKIGIDVLSFENNLEKLSLYPGVIDEETLNHLISNKLEDNIFEFINALLLKNRVLSFKILNDFKVLNIDVLTLTLILSTQVRFYFQVKYLKSQFLDNATIAERLNCKEGRIYYAHNKIQAFSLEQLLDILGRLSNLDQTIKSGKDNGEVIFELFILEVMR